LFLIDELLFFDVTLIGATIKDARLTDISESGIMGYVFMCEVTDLFLE
jgi:hypothetical protein